MEFYPEWYYKVSALKDAFIQQEVHNINKK